MIHLYTAKVGNRWGVRPEQVKLLCSKQYVDHIPREGIHSGAVTAATSVTCPACLAILIPIEEKRLAKMRENLLRSASIPGEPQ